MSVEQRIDKLVKYIPLAIAEQFGRDLRSYSEGKIDKKKLRKNFNECAKRNIEMACNTIDVLLKKDTK